MNDAEVDAMSQQYNRALDSQRKEIDSYRQSDALLREENAKLRADLSKEHSDSLQHHHAWMVEMEIRKRVELQKGELEARWKQQMQKEAHANEIFLEYEAVVREILANETIHSDSLLARARAILTPTEKREVLQQKCGFWAGGICCQEVEPCPKHGTMPTNRI